MPARITVPDETELYQRLAEADPDREAAVLHSGVLVMAGAELTGAGIVTQLATTVAEHTGNTNDAGTRAKQKELFAFIPHLINAVTDDETIRSDARAFLRRALRG